MAWGGGPEKKKKKRGDPIPQTTRHQRGSNNCIESAKIVIPAQLRRKLSTAGYRRFARHGSACGEPRVPDNPSPARLDKIRFGVALADHDRWEVPSRMSRELRFGLHAFRKCRLGPRLFHRDRAGHHGTRIVGRWPSFPPGAPPPTPR